jgi:hypothetical protein
MPPVKTLPEGTAGVDSENAREDLYKIGVTVNCVVVPVTVKDGDDVWSVGYAPRFLGVRKRTTADTRIILPATPSASAAVIFDLGMSDAGVRDPGNTTGAARRFQPI